MKNNYFFLSLAFFSFQFSFAQLNYTCDMSSGCGQYWDNNGFVDNSSNYGGGCDGVGLNDNVWGSGSSQVVGAWNSSNILTSHAGSEITLSFKTKLTDWYSPYTDRTSTEWGNLKVYYKSSTPSEASPGTLITTINSSSSCATHEVTFNPGSTISNLFISFIYTKGSGDNMFWIDTLSIQEATGPSISVGSAITGLDYNLGSGPSTSQSTTVSGSSLEADITLDAPTNFEISTDNSSFSDSVILTQSGGSVSSTTIHARLKSGLSVDNYSGNITASSTNATSQTISL
ncbi:MAG: hypothetical protein CMP80_05225, partial [Formosa sp.]|nr:hypothetical protein [Formosa sp.]